MTCGGKHALYSLFQSIFEEGDEVIIPTPYWVSYPAMVELAGATPVFVETHEEEDYQLNAEMLKKHITSKTKGIILNYPSNPCGSVFYLPNLEQIGKLAVENGIYLISDEIYDKISLRRVQTYEYRLPRRTDQGDDDHYPRGIQDLFDDGMEDRFCCREERDHPGHE